MNKVFTLSSSLSETEEFSDPKALAALQLLDQKLAVSNSPVEIKQIRDQAEVLRSYLKKRRCSQQMQNTVATVKLQAERKTGTLLASMKLRGGDRRSSRRGEQVTLKDLDITPSESKYWQLEAEVPEAEFQTYVRMTNDLGEEISSAGLQRLARQLRSQRAFNKRSQKPPRQVDDRVQAIENVERVLASLKKEVRRTCSKSGTTSSPTTVRTTVSQLSQIKEILQELLRAY